MSIFFGRQAHYHRQLRLPLPVLTSSLRDLIDEASGSWNTPVGDNPEGYVGGIDGLEFQMWRRRSAGPFSPYARGYVRQAGEHLWTVEADFAPHSTGLIVFHVLWFVGVGAFTLIWLRAPEAMPDGSILPIFLLVGTLSVIYHLMRARKAVRQMHADLDQALGLEAD